VTATAPAYQGAPLSIELAWPAKELSPNARVHFMVLHRFKAAAKKEAFWATRIVKPFTWAHDGPLHVRIIAHPPKAWRTGDDDNLTARCKAHLDGIADALGVNDSTFTLQSVVWADRTERGKLIVEINP
jgi:crossover junction endodeoxyribonuclease RusA